MARPSVREKLLQAGVQQFWQDGYAAAGVRDIVARADARPGSFTNHFSSKEVFACEVLDRYSAYVRGLIEAALSDKSVPPAGRLRRYVDAITVKLAEADWARGCLVGNFSVETTNYSDRLRLKLSEIFEQWRAPFAACIAEGQARGEITAAFAPEDLADFLLSGWQGAMLRMKVNRSPEPLERFKKILFATVFRQTSTRKDSE